MKTALALFVGLIALGLGTGYRFDEDKARQSGAFVPREHLAVATFAGGCFWCVESDFEKLPGVVEAVSGYGGGKIAHPTYDQVVGGKTEHAETVQVYYDPNIISYAQLLQSFWRQIDPTDDNGQFVDRGRQYRPAVFTHDEMQMELALASMRELETSGRYEAPLRVSIEPLRAFYRAESYHQDYYKNQAGISFCAGSGGTSWN